MDKLRENHASVTPNVMEQIDHDYDFTNSVDPKIKQRWYWLGLMKRYPPVFQKAHEFISTQGKTENL